PLPGLPEPTRPRAPPTWAAPAMVSAPVLPPCWIPRALAPWWTCFSLEPQLGCFTRRYFPLGWRWTRSAAMGLAIWVYLGKLWSRAFQDESVVLLERLVHYITVREWEAHQPEALARPPR